MYKEKKNKCCFSVGNSYLTLLKLHGLQHARHPCLSLAPGVCSNSCQLNRWWNQIISSSVALFFSSPQYFLESRFFAVSQLFSWDDQSIGASVSTSVLMNIQGRYLRDWLVWSPWSQRDSQESSPALQFESINYSALSLLYHPTLTSIHDYWKKKIKKDSFDYMDLWWQSHVSAF